MNHNEDLLQESCVRWFRLQYPEKIIFAIPNGGKRNIYTAFKLKKSGVLAGVPDLFVAEVDALEMYHGFFIELKFGRNKPTADQATVMGKLRSNGYRVDVIYSFDEFVDAINLYFMKNK